MERKFGQGILDVDKGYFRSKMQIWDGDPKHIPEEYNGRWILYVNIGEIDVNGNLHVFPDSTCYLKDRGISTPEIGYTYGTFKESCRPGLFSSKEAVMRAVTLISSKYFREYWGLDCHEKNPLKWRRKARNSLFSTGHDKWYTYFGICRIEDLVLRRRSDVRKELKIIRDDKFNTIAKREVSRKSVNSDKPSCVQHGIVTDHHTTSNSYAYPQVMVSPIRQKSSSRPRNESKDRIWWILRDRKTGKYLRVPNRKKGESGDCWLVDDKKECTIFEFDDANSVATTIENAFWHPVYSQWNMCVELLDDVKMTALGTKWTR